MFDSNITAFVILREVFVDRIFNAELALIAQNHYSGGAELL